jgi:dTDP-4-amino-4,6-dideoxygalactose transaminase
MFVWGKKLCAYGDAGGIVTNDDTLAESMRILRDHGMKPRYHHKRVAWNERMDGIQGAVLNIKLPHLQTWNDQRREHAARYRSLLDGVGVLRFFDECVDRTAIYHLFVIRTEQRDALSQFLQDRGIQTGIHYPIPLHLQGAYSSLGYHKGAYPIAETLAAEILSLPMFPELSEAQQHEVCGAIKDFFAS